MAVRNRITEKNPRTGALPSEQAAAQMTELHPDNGGKNHVWQQDKLIWQLVMNCVDYASEQFGENLQFNSETLTNVLYDNLYKLLGDKFNEDEFINWVVDELLSRGCVIREVQQPAKEETGKSDAKQEEQAKQAEQVHELQKSERDELASKIDASIQLIKANKLNIFKLFNDIDGKITDLSQVQQEDEDKQGKEILERRDKEITELVDRIQTNQEKIDGYI